jgi:hypothetical protein
MKRVRIVQAALMLAVAALIPSCSSSRRNTYADYYPPNEPQYSLIIHSNPGPTVRRYHDGRYYYRNPQGYVYWRGYDNRYYLDRSRVSKGYYHHRQYNDWKRGNGKYYRNNPRR